jgi:hypothetical protein
MIKRGLKMVELKIKKIWTCNKCGGVCGVEIIDNPNNLPHFNHTLKTPSRCNGKFIKIEYLSLDELQRFLCTCDIGDNSCHGCCIAIRKLKEKVSHTKKKKKK